MSGPKSYAPPPMYSIKVFNGKLNTVFKLQNILKKLIEEIEDTVVADHDLNIFINAKQDLKSENEQNQKAIKALIFNYKGRFNQDTYNNIDTDIEAKIVLLKKQIKKLENIKNITNEKLNDYQNYIKYLQYLQNAENSFNEFISSIKEYLTKQLAEKEPDLLKTSLSQLDEVQLTIEKNDFLDGFSSKFEKYKTDINNTIINKEEQVNKVRKHVSELVIKKYTHYNQALIPNDNTEGDAEIQRITKKINTLINNCPDSKYRRKYQSNLEKLKESTSLHKVFYYKDMHDAILINEKQRILKEELINLLEIISNGKLHQKFVEEKTSLKKEILSLLGNDNIKPNQTAYLLKKWNTLQEENMVFDEQEALKEKEGLFLKTQIINSLENMGYEVMDDLEVIDFEKENDFLLKIRNQENYLNLKFVSDNSFRYVFQIPENKEELSKDQQMMKLHEMEVTCQEFQTVLADLKQMGLNIDLKSAKPVALSSIISVTEKHKGKIKKETHAADTKKQLKRKYLE